MKLRSCDLSSALCSMSSLRPRAFSKWLLMLGVVVLLLDASSGAQDVLMHHYDAYRSGVQSHEVKLMPKNLGTSSFGRLFLMPVDGQVYAQPLWVGGLVMNDGNAHNVLFVATEHDSVYAFDADGRTPAKGFYWRESLLQKGETTIPAGDTNTTDIMPEIGITGTPVIDRKAGILYVVAKSKSIVNGAPTYVQRLHALNLATGKEMVKGPVTIAASVPGTGDQSDGTNVPFNPLREGQRASLALSAGSVWIAWASHGDNGPYHGWLLGYKASDLTQQTGVMNTTPNGSQGGIWMSGGGISVDSLGNLYAASGNGDFTGDQANGTDFSSTVFKVTPNANGVSMSSFFTPRDQANLSGQDLDMGTSAGTLLDNPGGPFPRLLVTTDKDGQIYLLNRDNLGGYSQSNNDDVQDFSDGGFNVHESFAFFNNQLYLAPDGGPLSTWTFNPSTGLFNPTGSTASDSTFGCDGCDGAGATPSVSANGTSNGIVWILDDSGFNSNPAVLHAFDPTLGTELYNSSWAPNDRDMAASAVKFTTPTIANGFVYVGGGSAVTVYGLFKYAPSTTASPVLTPGPGDESRPVSVTMTDKTPGAVIHFTVNGSMPTASSPIYSKPILISSTTQLQAIAVAPGLVNGPVSGGTYLFGTLGNVFTFDGGISPTNLALNGSSQVTAKRLRLTDGNNWEAGSGYFRMPVKITNFTTNFDFQMSNANADGMTFVLQNQSTTAVGPAGGGLGYGPDTAGNSPGISPSSAVKFDLYDNQGEGANSTGYYTGGVAPTIPAVNLTPSGLDLHSGHIFSVQLHYNGQMLTETITDAATHRSFTHGYAAALTKALGGNSAWVGFTAATGGLGVVADVLNWSYSNPAVEQFNASDLSASVNGPALTPYFNTAFPGNKGTLFPATTIGQSVTFTLTVKEEATFAINLLGDRNSNHGITQLSIDGQNFGNPVDGFTAMTAGLSVNYGNLLLKPGPHKFTFTVTGKNKSSTGYGATFGYLKLVP